MALSWFAVIREDDNRRLRLERIEGRHNWCGVVAYFDDAILWDEKTGAVKSPAELIPMPADWADWPGGKAPVNGSGFYVPYK